MIKKDQHCFENISATKARIFMKFYVVVNCYLVNLSVKFYDDPCINACTRVVNMCVHILLQVHDYTTHASAFMHRSS